MLWLLELLDLISFEIETAASKAWMEAWWQFEQCDTDTRLIQAECAEALVWLRQVVHYRLVLSTFGYWVEEQKEVMV